MLFEAGPAPEIRPVASAPLRVYAALALGVLGTSWSAIFVRWANVPGGSSAFYRVAISELALVAIFVLQQRKFVFEVRSMWLAVVGGVFLGADLGLYNAAVLLSPITNVTLLCNNTPVFVGVLSWIMFRQRPNSSFWVGLIFATAGSILIIGLDLVRHVSLGAVDLMSLGASVCFAVFLILTAEARNRFNPYTVLALSLGGSSAFLFLFDVAAGVSLKIPNMRSWIALIGLALVTQLFGYLSLTYALGHLPATVTSIGLLAQLPIAAVLAAILFHEPMSLTQAVGGGLVVFGIWAATRQSNS